MYLGDHHDVQDLAMFIKHLFEPYAGFGVKAIPSTNLFRDPSLWHWYRFSAPITLLILQNFYQTQHQNIIPYIPHINNPS